MRGCPSALGWIDPEVSGSPEWDAAQIRRLARRLGYALIWPDDFVVPLVDYVRGADVDAVLVPAPACLCAGELDALMHVVDIETVWPRMSFVRWSALGPGR
ncbi:hypothetical protein NONO_c65100 [Nocardia nova SH22a]|uniref:Uncharacterized protein n=1 Tax=Nocardia nova SH22a TaxID=1415166 RepID=W5TPI1_9NOCA|nr:hypothetical protein NONO_c65100 [Nocardia nova SH22a]